MKRVLQVILGIVVTLIGFFIYHNYPANSEAKAISPLADTNHIKHCLELVINTSAPRNYKNTSTLDTVAERIRTEFLQHTDRVSFQTFAVRNHDYKNVIASFEPDSAERIIVGAHYDVCKEQDGADDNASGVAGILELARLLKNQPLQYRIDLVAYSLEEPPFFATTNMGSYFHAQSLHDNKVPVLGMISLEMIGYYSDTANSQTYPLGFFKWIYGDKGNFMTIVQKSFCGAFARKFKKLAFDNNSIPAKSFRVPSFFGGIDLSDHRNYWKFGYSAIMVTNTSFYRNQHYHEKSDQLATLDITRMGQTIETVYRVLMAYK
ncbi:MAG TPA: M28 family peptidase [Phnomibacter sp.]|nr:M28 family peptidase [Phnomibacter sp.]